MCRSLLKQDLRHSFGAYMTICQIKRNSALDRVRAVLETAADPGANLGNQGQTQKPFPGNGVEDEEIEAEDYQTDIEDIAHQQIIST